MAGGRTRSSWHPITRVDGPGSGRRACAGSGWTHAPRQGKRSRESAPRGPMTAATNLVAKGSCGLGRQDAAFKAFQAWISRSAVY